MRCRAKRGHQSRFIDPVKPLPTKTGLPRLDRPSWDKGFADGFHGNVWWPGPGTEPLSYASGYTEAQVERDTRRVERKP
jgi:hypothetical protein